MKPRDVHGRCGGIIYVDDINTYVKTKNQRDLNQNQRKESMKKKNTNEFATNLMQKQKPKVDGYVSFAGES